jgi:transposase
VGNASNIYCQARPAIEESQRRTIDCSSRRFCRSPVLAARGAIYRSSWAIGITYIRRFSRWGKSGVWQRVVEAVSTDADLQALMVDSTIVRAHQHSAGAQKKKVREAIGRSRGGLSTKIHMAVDALGNPVRWQLTGGEVHDITRAPALIAGLEAEQVIADKGYDSNAFIACIEMSGAQAVIPPRKTRLEKRAYDRHAYRERG